MGRNLKQNPALGGRPSALTSWVERERGGHFSFHRTSSISQFYNVIMIALFIMYVEVVNVYIGKNNKEVVVCTFPLGL